jgi:hypothetical protein
MQTIQRFLEKSKKQSLIVKIGMGCSSFFILCCMCSIPIVFLNSMSSNPSKTSENLLVGRHPEQWMQSNHTFIAFDNNIPYLGRFAYPHEELGITSYGFNWNEPSCSKAMSSSVSSGQAYVILYKSISDAKNAYSKYVPSVQEEVIFQNQQNSSLRTGNTAEIWFYQSAGCDVTDYYAVIMFRRNNVLGFAHAVTFLKSPEGNLQKVLLDIGTQLDQIILKEINEHPGNESDLVKVSNSATIIEMPSDTNQSGSDSGNDTGSFGTDDPNLEEECIHSIYAPTYKMCDEEYQFLQSQDP